MSGLDSGNRKDYSKYDRMSTESLEELLRLDAELPNGEGSDIDEILYISEVIAKREKEHPTGRYSEMDVDAAWETFQTEYRPFVTEGRSLYDFDDDEPSSTETASLVPGTSSPFGLNRISARGRRRLGRVVSFAAAITILLGLMTFTAYAMGYDLWAVVAQWTKDTFTFVSASKANEAEVSLTDATLNDGEYADLQAALDAHGITEQLVPTWIPGDFTVRTITVDEQSDPSYVAFYARYKYENKIIVIQINKYHENQDIEYSTWQKDVEDAHPIEINGHSYYIMTNMERPLISWVQGPFECYIIGDLSESELIKMVESIN